LISGSWFLVSDIWSRVTSLWYLVSGFWFLISGFWFLVSGRRFLLSGFGFLGGSHVSILSLEVLERVSSPIELYGIRFTTSFTPARWFRNLRTTSSHKCEAVPRRARV